MTLQERLQRARAEINVKRYFQYARALSEIIAPFKPMPEYQSGGIEHPPTIKGEKPEPEYFIDPNQSRHRN